MTNDSDKLTFTLSREEMAKAIADQTIAEDSEGYTKEKWYIARDASLAMFDLLNEGDKAHTNIAKDLYFRIASESSGPMPEWQKREIQSAGLQRDLQKYSPDMRLKIIEELKLSPDRLFGEVCNELMGKLSTTEERPTPPPMRKIRRPLGGIAP